MQAVNLFKVCHLPDLDLLLVPLPAWRINYTLIIAPPEKSAGFRVVHEGKNGYSQTKINRPEYSL